MDLCENGLCAALEANAAVAVADDGVEMCYLWLGGDDALETSCENGL